MFAFFNFKGLSNLLVAAKPASELRRGWRAIHSHESARSAQAVQVMQAKL
jgi:hypothetical protein